MTLVCKICGKDIDPTHVQQGNCHYTCFNNVIDVWFISLQDDTKNGFYEKDVKSVMGFLEDIEDAYVIKKETMSEGQFLCLPEFQGF